MHDASPGPPDPWSRRQFLTTATGIAAVAIRRPRTATAADRPLDPELNDSAGPAAGGRSLALGTQQVVWSAPVTFPTLTLSFDDGPDPEFTPRVLELLRARDIHATFDAMGWNVERHPDLARAIVADGHELANHTWTHRDLATEDPATTEAQIRRGRDTIIDVTGQRPRFFRPPRGELTGYALRVAAALGHDVLLYSLLGDVAGIEHPDQVRRYVDSHLRPGMVIAFHDGIGRGTFTRRSRSARALIARREAELRALPAILDEALHRGMRFTTATDLIDASHPPRPGASPPNSTTSELPPPSES